MRLTCFASLWIVIALMTGPPAARAASVEQDRAVSLIGETLRGYVRSTERPFHAYHYTTRKALGSGIGEHLDATDPRSRDYLERSASAFCSLNIDPPGYSMPGLYLAIDPVISRDFGHNDWVLQRFEITAGTRYLDLERLERDRRQVMTLEINDALGAAGCRDVEQANWLDKLMFRYDNRRCREITVRVLESLGVDALAYSWASADFSFCGDRPSTSWILLNPDRAPKEGARVFARDQMPAPEERAEAGAMLSFFAAARDANLGGDTTVTKLKRMFPQPLWSPAPAPASPAEAAAWARSNLLGCQK